MAALDPHTLLSQYGHTAWRAQDGFPSQAESITQTTDGYIWIVAVDRLYRFDGVKFRPWTPPNNQSLRSTVVNCVFGARDGSLWIGTAEGLARWKDGRLTNYTTSLNSPGIFAILEDHAGRIWVTRYAVNNGMGSLCWVKDSSLNCYGQKDGNPADYAMELIEDSTGDLWFTGRTLWRWHQGSITTYSNKPHSPTGNVIYVAAAPSGEIWVSLDGTGPKSGVQHFSDGKWTSYVVPGFDGRTFQNASLFFDNRQTLWIGTETHGLYRIQDGVANPYGKEDGLSSNTINTLYEDREGNVWVGTDNGTDLFRDNAVIDFSAIQGLTGSKVSAVLTVNGNTVWVGSGGGLNVIQTKPSPSIRRQAVPGHGVNGMFVDSRGQVWLGVDHRAFAYKMGSMLK